MSSIVLSTSLGKRNIYIYIYIGGWGVRPTGKSFRFVTCVRAAGSKVGTRLKCPPAAFPFSLLPWEAFPFPL